jgi:serine/tyrosine/threonine adenylyltransferase
MQFKQTSYATLGSPFISPTPVEPLPNPHLVAYSADAAKLIGLDAFSIQAFNGEGMKAPYSAVYAGHQFGHYVPQLGDGRAHTIGEMNGWEIQLKGSGITPYSRFGDGKAVLRSSIREFLCSEAMAALGIPTTRALCVLGSDEPVRRERIETAAMLTRLAPSHIRFGHFEYFYFTEDTANLRKLADFCLEHHFPKAANATQPYAAMLREVTQRTARLIAQWQCAGFCHGVMNTDNMSILGLTIDYGPFGFLDAFDAHHICNHSDESGRYAFDQQPLVGLWNLNCLARALSPLVEMEDLKAALRAYEPAFLEAFERGMLAKLGLENKQEGDEKLIANTLKLLHENKLNYTIFFRSLFEEPNARKSADIERWFNAYSARLTLESRPEVERFAAMKTANPKYILRNYLAEQAIEKAEQGDFAETQKLHEILRKPFDEQPEHESYASAPPDWAAGICVSCSS